MKRISILAVTSILIFSLSIGAAAFALDAEGTYLLSPKRESKLRGFSLSVSGEVYPNLLLDGSFLSVGDKDSDTAERLIRAGGLYRVVTEEDLQVFVGLGFAGFKDGSEESEADPDGEENSGRGLYGKLGLKTALSPKIILTADLGYAPKFNFGGDDVTLLAARAGAGYQILDNLALQVKVEHYRVGEGEANSRTLVGGGVAVSF
ncbi:MAG TPA: hypothetical protein GX521_02820 [Firmicutes bacterium]|nr:hypothetical protein [Bacillota bacterium]